MAMAIRKTAFAVIAALACLACAAKTDIMVFLDTEDYTDPVSDDAILEMANLLEEEGVVGNFDVVGFLVQRLIESRRFDVLDSLRNHTVGSQSLYHSLHPTECEYAAVEDARLAYRNMLEYEATCVGMLRAGFGLDKIEYMTGPGNSFIYIAGHVCHDMGMKVGLDIVRGCAYKAWYANLLNLPYTWGIESLIPPKPEPDYKALLDAWAEKPYMGLAMHPNMMRATTFWDLVNYVSENHCEWRKWKAAPRRNEADVKEFYRRVRKLMRALKSDSRFNVTDVRECIASIKPRRTIVPADMPALEAALKADFGPVGEPASYCVADVFQAAAKFLLGEKEFTPDLALGFLDRPVGVTEPTTLSADDLRAAVAKIDLKWYLPNTIDVGGKAIGPADCLFAMFEVLRTGAKSVTVTPREQLGSFKHVPKLENFSYRPGWPIHAKDLPDQMLSDRLRYQLWTLRFE